MMPYPPRVEIAPPDELSTADLRVIAGWFLANCEGTLVARTHSGRVGYFNALREVVGKLGQETGLGLSVATLRALLDEADQAVLRWAL